MKLQSVRNWNSNLKNQTFQYNTTQRHYSFDTHWGMTIGKYEKALTSVIKSLWFFKSRKLCGTVKSLKFTADGGLTLKATSIGMRGMRHTHSRVLTLCVQNQGCREVSRCNTGKCWHKHFRFVTHSLFIQVFSFVHSQHSVYILPSETFNCWQSLRDFHIQLYNL